MKTADLHLHTIFSDGTYSPAELIEEAKRVDLSCIAVVDHDTTEGLEITIGCGKEKDIEVLAGIELTAEYNGLEVHILGYLINYQDRVLKARLDILKKIRVERIYKITDKLKDIGINLEAELVFDLAEFGTVGRLHVARAMVKKGLVKSTFEAFQKYIGEKCPAHVLGFRLTPSEAIKLIKDAGGIPILAHPYILGKEEMTLKIIDDGIMGLEVYYPEHSTSMVNSYLNLAKKYNLLVTGGSDCHGDAKPEVRLGSFRIPYALVERLKESRVL